MDSVLITQKNLSDRFSDRLYDPIRDIIYQNRKDHLQVKNSWIPKTLEILEPTDKILPFDKQYKHILLKEKIYQPIPEKLVHQLKSNSIQKIVYKKGEITRESNSNLKKYEVISSSKQSSINFSSKLKKIQNKNDKEKFNLFSILDLPFNFVLGKDNVPFNCQDMKNEIIAYKKKG